MAAMLQHLLIVGGETPALLHIVPLLLRAELQAQRVTRADEAIDLVEVNPILDRENRTAAMMVELAASLLGKSIL